MNFYYHMYGSTIGTLRVWLLQDGATNPLPLWELHGQQANSWQPAKLSIPNQTGRFRVSVVSTACSVMYVEQCSSKRKQLYFDSQPFEYN